MLLSRLAFLGRTPLLTQLVTRANASSSSSSPPPSKEDKIREKNPVGKLAETKEGTHPYQEKEPLKPHPGGVNPTTGEIGGPAGPEPTRFGDWERKGRVSDF